MRLGKILSGISLMVFSIYLTLTGDQSTRIAVVVILNLLIALMGYLYSTNEKENPSHAKD